MNIKAINIDQIIPYANNPRINQASVTKVANSIKEFGWQQPIVVDTDMIIIAGHTRLLAAQLLKLDKVPVHIADNLTPEQIKAYRLADNRLHEDATWDHELLSIELGELSDSDSNFDLDLVGFNAQELAKLLASYEDSTNSNSNKIKELSESEFEELTHKCPKCNFEWN